MTLFDYLNFKIEKNYKKTSDYEYFINNKDILKKFHEVSDLEIIDNDYGIFRLNIIIKGLKNKLRIEEESELLTETQLSSMNKKKLILNELPYLSISEERVYVPFLSLTMNQYYSAEMGKLNKYPYSELKKSFVAMYVDPFDEYGYRLYDSLFSSLIPIYAHGVSKTFYSVEMETLYVINNQGRFDARIPLFDNRLDYKNKLNIFERLEDLSKKYYQTNKMVFLEGLRQNEFVSPELFQELYELATRKDKKKIESLRKE